MKNVALITGASSGIGKELAILHAENGGDLILVARRRALLVDLKNMLEGKYGITALVIQKDLSKVSSSKEIFNEVRDKNIQIDYLINNAGFASLGHMHEMDMSEIQNMILVNVLALSNLTRLFMSDFVTRNNGKILNVSSSAALTPGAPYNAVYSASKHFVKILTNSINYECRKSNVTATTLIPHFTKTEFQSIAGIKPKGMEAKSVAKVGYEGMLKGKYNVVIGFTIFEKILSVFSPLMPLRFKLGYVYKMMKSSQI